MMQAGQGTDPKLLAFAESRQRVVERLIETRDDVDTWLKANLHGNPDITQLAQLEGLLQVRRELLSQITKLDDDMLDYLVERRSKVRDGQDGSKSS
jgi:hypothetical protein